MKVGGGPRRAARRIPVRLNLESLAMPPGHESRIRSAENSRAVHSNSNRLQEIGEETGTDSYLIPDAGSLNPAWLAGARTVGITAGASAPEELVQALLDRLGETFDIAVTDVDGIEENVTFRLPRELLAPEEWTEQDAAHGRPA